MTQPELDDLHTKWRKILRLEHMNGTVKLVKKVDKRGNLGECATQYSLNRYRIKILDPSCVKPIHDNQDVEATLVHELNHVRSWHLAVQDLDEVHNELYERFVEETAQIMVSLHRGQK